MKKRSLLIVGLLIAALYLTAQQSSPYFIEKNGLNTIELTVSPGELRKEKIYYEEKEFTIIALNGFQHTVDVGFPTLPMMVKLLEIPLCDSIIVNYRLFGEKIINIEEYPELFPVQQSYPKSYRGERKFSKENSVYELDQFYGKSIVEVVKRGIYRNVNIATLYVSPVQYNPITKELKTYDHIEISISFLNPDIVATEEMKRLHANRLFSIDNSPVINPVPLQSKDDISAAPLKYLIVSHEMFRGHLDEFIAWKKRKGFLVQVAYTDDADVGTSYNSIEAFIKSTYSNATIENPAPTYVLLVGDVEQIPAKRISSFWTSHPTDLYYFTWTDGDDLPDCYYGRFSANTIEELQPQIEKTLMYEQFTMPDPSYLDKALLIAGTDSYWSQTHADGQVNYSTSLYFNEAYGYSTVYKYNYNCSSESQNIRQKIGEEGVGWVNYTAHGEVTEWSDPEFRASQIDNMSNEGKYPVMIGNCCLSNKFDQTSFGESLVRANKKGALAYIGASNSTYWDEDVYWSVGYRQEILASMDYDASNLGMYDRLFHTHNELIDAQYVSLGQIIAGGNFGVENSGSSRKSFYWEVYHLMGDPSLMPWLTQPETMQVTHSNVSQGMTTLQVTSVPYAYVALTDQLELVVAAFADANGQTTLTFPTINDLENLELAISAQNYKTYFKSFGSSSSIDDTPLTVNLYPNPADEFVTIHTNHSLRTLSLYDITGKILQNFEDIYVQKMRIDLTNLTSGIYFIKIIDQNNQQFIKKIIKK